VHEFLSLSGSTYSVTYRWWQITVYISMYFAIYRWDYHSSERDFYHTHCVYWKSILFYWPIHFYSWNYWHMYVFLKSQKSHVHRLFIVSYVSIYTTNRSKCFSLFLILPIRFRTSPVFSSLPICEHYTSTYNVFHIPQITSGFLMYNTQSYLTECTCDIITATTAQIHLQ